MNESWQKPGGWNHNPDSRRLREPNGGGRPQAIAHDPHAARLLSTPCAELADNDKDSCFSFTMEGAGERRRYRLKHGFRTGACACRRREGA